MTDRINFQSAEFKALLAEEKAIASAQALIEWLMDEEGLSRKSLAERLGISQAAVSQLLGLSPKNLTVRRLARVLHALGDDLVLTSTKRKICAQRGHQRASDWGEAYAAKRCHSGKIEGYLAANDHLQTDTPTGTVLEFSDWFEEAA